MIKRADVQDYKCIPPGQCDIEFGDTAGVGFPTNLKHLNRLGKPVLQLSGRHTNGIFQPVIGQSGAGIPSGSTTIVKHYLGQWAVRIPLQMTFGWNRFMILVQCDLQSFQYMNFILENGTGQSLLSISGEGVGFPAKPPGFMNVGTAYQGINATGELKAGVQSPVYYSQRADLLIQCTKELAGYPPGSTLNYSYPWPYWDGIDQLTLWLWKECE